VMGCGIYNRGKVEKYIIKNFRVFSGLRINLGYQTLKGCKKKKDVQKEILRLSESSQI